MNTNKKQCLIMMMMIMIDDDDDVDAAADGDRTHPQDTVLQINFKQSSSATSPIM